MSKAAEVGDHGAASLILISMSCFTVKEGIRQCH